MSGVRLDKWLWAARFFKTRSQATHAANGGKVSVNGGGGKAGQTVRVGDRLEIRKAGQQFRIEVTDLADRRGSATAAEALYHEDEADRAARVEALAVRRAEARSQPRPDGRPDRKGRRQLRDIKHRGG